MENNIFNYNNTEITFLSGNKEVMINATEMAKAFGKRPVDYLRLPSTTELINAKVRKSHSDENQIVKTVNGGTNPGTWMHEDIALDFAQWLSVDFKLWCNDRIKELMRFGMTATQPTLEAMVANPDLVIQLATNLKKEREEKEYLAEQNRLQDKQLKESAPKVEYFDKALSSVGTYTATQIAKEYGWGAETINRKLCEKKIQYKQNGQWLLSAKYDDKGYTKSISRTFTRSDGTTGSQMQTVWTERGRMFIHDLLDDHLKVKQDEKRKCFEINI